MKTLLVIIVVLAAVAAIVLVIAVSRPDAFRVERSTLIKAPADRIYPLIEDFRQWRGWSPFEELDPNLKRTYGGAERGDGATYAWDGTGKAGAGRMEVIEAEPSKRILINLDFSKPFEAHNKAEFTIVPEGDGSRVTWAMYGPNPLVAKLMQMVMSMDSMVGGEFEKGLASLKALAEQRAVEAPKG